MRTNADQRKARRNVLDIPSAAYEAGYSSRHFLRIIEEDRIPVMQIGRKCFIVLRDLEAWKSTRGEARLEESIRQLDVWLKQRVQASAEPIAELDDKE
jgi:hypothetical protein